MTGPRTDRSGRRSRPTNQPRKHRAVHLTDADYATGRRLAQARGLSFSAWVESVIQARQQPTNLVGQDEEE